MQVLSCKLAGQEGAGDGHACKLPHEGAGDGYACKLPHAQCAREPLTPQTSKRPHDQAASADRQACWLPIMPAL